MDSTIAEKLQQAEAKIAQSELQYQRINANIAAAYDEAAAKGATMPATENSDNLADAVASISESKGIIERSATALASNAAVCANYAFYYWGTLTSVSLPNAESIGPAAFRNCSNLNAVSIPNATFLYTAAFRDCASLTRILLPSVTSIAATVFEGCTNLTAIILNQRVTLLSSNAIPSQAILYVENSDLTWYSTATNWSAIYADGRIKSIDDLPQ